MKLTGVFLAVCCGLILFSACKKSEDDNDDKKKSAATQKLQDGKWQITGSQATLNYMGKDTTIDYYSGWRTCEQDDIVMFEDEGKGTTDENTNKCPEDDQVGYITWELQNNDTKLKITTSKHTTIADIVELTSTQMKLQTTENDSTWGPIIYLETFKNIK